MSDNLPIDAAPEGNARPTVISRRRVVLVMLILAHAAFGAYYVPANETLASAAMGAIFAQPVVLAVWAAFARQRFYYRLLWALLLCTYLSFADDLGLIPAKPGMKPGQTILLMLAFFIETLLVLLLIGRFFRWKMADPEEKNADSAYLARHYGIHHLLVLTAIVALACGLVRSLLQLTRAGFPYDSATEFIWDLGLLSVIVFPACIVPWITLTDGRRRYVSLVATLLIVAALDSVGFLVMMLMQRFSFAWDVGKYYAFMQIGAVLSALATTLVLRYCGFRMVREPKTSA